jgi:hypothetical protein
MNATRSEAFATNSNQIRLLRATGMQQIVARSRCVWTASARQVYPPKPYTPARTSGACVRLLTCARIAPCAPSAIAAAFGRPVCSSFSTHTAVRATRSCSPPLKAATSPSPCLKNRRSSLRPSLVISQLGKNESTVRLRQDLAGFRHRSAQALTLEVCGSRRKRRGAERFPCRVGTRRYRLGARLLMLGERIKCGANHA